MIKSREENANDLFPAKIIAPNTSAKANQAAEEASDEIYEDIYDDDDFELDTFKTRKIQNLDENVETSTLPSKFSETESTNSRLTVIFKNDSNDEQRKG